MRSRFLGVALVLLSLGIGASAQNTSTGQLDSLKNLPQDQQDALLQSLAGKGNQSVTKTDQKLSNPQTILPRNDQSTDLTEKYPKDKTKDGHVLRMPDEDPELQADDSVLIDLTPLDIKRKQNNQAYPYGNNAAANPNGVNNIDLNGANNPLATTGMIPNANDNTNGRTGTNNLNKKSNNYDYGRVKQDEEKTATDEETEKSEKRRQLILRNNPYHLNRFGVLEIPGMPAIPLAGLTADEATNRLSADPDLRDYTVKLTLLRLKPFDEESLKPFGYDLFEGVPSTFAPVSDIQVPNDYLVGPGDTLNIQLYGSEPATYSLTVQRDGRVNFPKLGPVMVSGLTFTEVRSTLEDRVQQQLIGSHISVAMGDLRSIRVFVLGEAEKPGSYTVSGLSTMTNALFVSGGVKKIGSLRNIELKRDGRLVTVLDLYDLLLHGDTSHDQHLMPGDVIFIPPWVVPLPCMERSGGLPYTN
jgi:polysaccharide biosynthesis/export protein